MGLLQWQANRAFAGCQEETLRQLSAHLQLETDVTTGSEELNDTDVEFALATALMRHVEASLTEAGASKRMQTALLNDIDAEGCIDGKTCDRKIFDDVVLEDLLDKCDRKDIREVKKAEQAFIHALRRKRAVVSSILKQSYDSKPVGPRVKTTPPRR